MMEEGLTDVTVGSLDVSALYPSLEHEESAEAVYRMVLASKTEMKGIDWCATQVFLASNLSIDQVKKKGLVGLVPGRLKRRGNRPGNTTTELSAKRPDPYSEDPAEPLSKWAHTDPSKLSRSQKRHLIARACQVAVLNIFAHHQYQFEGKTYRHSSGAPIGLRLTSIVARIVMDEWMQMFLVRMDDAGMILLALAKYVDDLNIIMMMLKLGSRWEDGKVTHSLEREQEDREGGRSRDMVTLQVAKAVADSIHSWIQFTLDAAELHESGMCPVLDLQVWIKRPINNEDGLQAEMLAWMFYEKPTAADTVMRSTSAFTWRQKTVTMTMEVYRRLRNSSRQLNMIVKSNLLKTFVDKMRRSGYFVSTVAGVLKSGVEYYYRKLKIDLEGGPKMNMIDDTDEVKRRREKIDIQPDVVCQKERRREGEIEKGCGLESKDG